MFWNLVIKSLLFVLLEQSKEGLMNHIAIKRYLPGKCWRLIWETAENFFRHSNHECAEQFKVQNVLHKHEGMRDLM